MILVATSPAPCVEMAQSQEIDSAVTCRSTMIRPFNDAGNSFSAWERETPSTLFQSPKHHAAGPGLLLLLQAEGAEADPGAGPGAPPQHVQEPGEAPAAAVAVAGRAHALCLQEAAGAQPLPAGLAAERVPEPGEESAAAGALLLLHGHVAEP